MEKLAITRWIGRVIWWAILVFVMSRYLQSRLPDLEAGKAVPADIVIFFVWIAVALLPLLTEITFFGVTFKKHIDALKQEVRDDIASLRTEVQTAVSVKQQVSQQFVWPSAPPDSLLPDIERRVKEALDRELAAQRAPVAGPTPTTPPDDTTYLFAVRYEIEREARRILNLRSAIPEDQRRFSFSALISTLTKLEVIDTEIGRAARDIYSICSLAIHGEDVSPAKIAFVRDLGPRVIAALSAIKE